MPYIEPYSVSTRAQYTIRVNERYNVQGYLKDAGIPTVVHYPISLNKQPAISNDEACPSVGDMTTEEVLSPPMHLYLINEAVETIAKVLVRRVTFLYSQMLSLIILGSNLLKMGQHFGLRVYLPKCILCPPLTEKVEDGRLRV